MAQRKKSLGIVHTLHGEPEWMVRENGDLVISGMIAIGERDAPPVPMGVLRISPGAGKIYWGHMKGVANDQALVDLAAGVLRRCCDEDANRFRAHAHLFQSSLKEKSWQKERNRAVNALYHINILMEEGQETLKRVMEALGLDSWILLPPPPDPDEAQMIP